MGNRYENTRSFRNRLPLYSDIFEEKGVKFIHQYVTTTFRPLSTIEERQLTRVSVTWQVGDRLEKLSAKHYGNPTYWWVIARYNQKPTDAHFALGDIVYIPTPLSIILNYYV
jgi:nucleoid-associated protein YgaU